MLVFTLAYSFFIFDYSFFASFQTIFPKIFHLFLSGIILSAVMVYAILYLWLTLSWQENRREPTPAGASSANDGVSIILPFRNEEVNLKTTISSVLNQKHSGLFELICVDDHSEDSSCQQIESFANPKLQLIKSKGDGKKAAIKTGIEVSRFDLIITIDADTHFGENWLSSMLHHTTDSGLDMCIGPVKGDDKDTFTSLVSLEFAALAGTGLASSKAGIPIMANGANLLFRKDKFEEVKGYVGNEHISSGDDVFLLRKFLDHGCKIGVCSNSKSIASTQMPTDFQSLLSQRIRWGSKNKAGGSAVSNVILLIVLATNVSFAIGVLGLFFDWISLNSLIIPWLIKALVDLVFLWGILGFFNQRNLLVWFPLISILFPIYLLLTSLASILLNTEWKGRPVAVK